MKFKYLFLISCLTSNLFAIDFRVDDCTDASLKLSCQNNRAEDQATCLRIRIEKIKECNSRMDDYEEQLQQWIYKKIQEKGQGVIDPLKVQKVKHLQKMKELKQILKWHDLNVRGKQFTRFKGKLCML